MGVLPWQIERRGVSECSKRLYNDSALMPCLHTLLTTVF